MKERPILYSAPMVRAKLAGIKTQTRRIVKPRKDRDIGCELAPHEIAGEVNAGELRNCPYGKPGDRLWVRESGWERPERTRRMMREGADTWPRFAYAADGYDDQDRRQFKEWGFKPRPSIHMPRWASRLTDEIIAVRVEHLQDISESDAIAEGIQRWPLGFRVELSGAPKHESRTFDTAQGAYKWLWESINGPASWNANPWVWVVETKPV